MTNLAGVLASPQRRVATPRRLGEVVAEEIVRELAGLSYGPGDKLPTEPDLQEAFGVSRTALREALKWVESRGLIAIRQGRGAVVTPVEDWDLTDPIVLNALLERDSQLGVFEQLMAIRRWLEPELARSAAAGMSDGDLAELADLLARMSKLHDDSEAYVDHDVRFHEVISRNASNLIARSILKSIASPLSISRKMMNAFPNASTQADAEHQAIFDALKAADGEAAAKAMRDHLAAGLRRGQGVGK